MVAQYQDLTKLKHAKMIAKEGTCHVKGYREWLGDNGNVIRFVIEKE